VLSNMPPLLSMILFEAMFVTWQVISKRSPGCVALSLSSRRLRMLVPCPFSRCEGLISYPILPPAILVKSLSSGLNLAVPSIVSESFTSQYV